MLIGAEKPRTATERALRQGYENALDAMLVADDDRICVYANSAAGRLLGYTRDELIGLRLEDILPGHLNSEAAEAWKLFMEAGTQVGEVELRRADGSLLWAEFSGMASFVPGRHLAILRDISEKRAAEQASIEANGRLEETQALAHVGSFEWNTGDERAHWSPELMRIAGRNPETEQAPTSAEFLELIHPDDRDEFLQVIATAIEESGSFGHVYRLVRRSGEVRTIENHGRVETDGTGVPVRMFGAAQDITERRRADEQIRLQANLLEQITMGVIASDVDRRITHWNRGAEELYGISATEAIGKTLNELGLVAQESMEIRKVMEATLGTGESWEGELMLRRGDDSVFPAYVSNSPVKDSEGKVVGYTGVTMDISQRRTAEDALRLQVQLLDQVEAAVIGLDLDRRITQWNRGAERLFGWTRKQAIGNRNEDLGLVTVDETTTLGMARAQVDSGSIWEGEMEMQRRDRNTFPGFVTYSMVQNDKGTPVGYVAVTVDLSEQKRVEAIAREAQSVLDAVVNSSPAVIYAKDREFRYLMANTEFERVFSLSPVGKTDDEIFSPDIVKSLRASDERVLEHDETLVEEEERPDENGARRSYLTHRFPLHDAEGNVFAVCGISTDITERKQSESELRRRAEQQAAIAALGRQALSGESIDELMTEAVEVATKMLDVEFAKVLELRSDGTELVLRAGVGFNPDLIGSKTVPGDGSNAAFTLAEGVPVIAEDYASETRFKPAEILREHGIRSGATVLIGQAEGAYGVLGAHSASPRSFSVDDVNFLQSVANVLAAAMARQRADLLETQLQRTQRLESVGQLAGGIAHDFNNLLAVILNYCEFVLEDLSDDQMRADVGEINAAAKRAAELTHQLLVFSRREVITPEPVDLSEIAAETEKLLRRTIPEHIHFRPEYQDRLWPVELGAGQADQILINLVVNARDALPRGGNISVKTENLCLEDGYAKGTVRLAPGRYVRLTVADDGVGMSSEVLAQAFDPFFTTKPQGEGTGLGLATIYGIVGQAGGHVEIYTEEGQGTALKVYLPAVGGDGTSASPESEAIRPANGETILVVEDEHAVRKVTERILEEYGYKVLTATDGRAAIRLHDEHELDLLLTDVVMPGMSGMDIAEEMRRRVPSLNVLFMSGYPGNVVSRHGIGDSGTSLVEKPFGRLTLLSAVGRALDGPEPG